MLLVLVMLAGRVLPQLFSINIVPSPSMIVRWSRGQVELGRMSNAVKFKERTNPSSTLIVSVFLTLVG